jgi:hypothetical protein
MTKKEKKQLAQDLIMRQMSIVGYGEAYEEYVKQIGSQTEADAILMSQMDRVAKLFGFLKAWFS